MRVGSCGLMALLVALGLSGAGCGGTSTRNLAGNAAGSGAVGNPSGGAAGNGATGSAGEAGAGASGVFIERVSVQQADATTAY